MSPEEWLGVAHELNEERTIKEGGRACQARTVIMKKVEETRNTAPFLSPSSLQDQQCPPVGADSTGSFSKLL